MVIIDEIYLLLAIKVLVWIGPPMEYWYVELDGVHTTLFINSWSPIGPFSPNKLFWLYLIREMNHSSLLVMQ